MSLEEIAPKKGERALIIGGSRSGKSTLLDHLVQYSVKTRPDIEVLMLDTKPRFRAEIEKFGPRNKFVRDADRNYNDWAPGPVVPGSVRLNIHADNPLANHWTDECRIVIAQCEEPAERHRLLQIADKWYHTKKRNKDRMLVCDELLDFYHPNGVCIDPKCNVPLKVNRAGGERGFSSTQGAQRPKGIPIQLSAELTRLYLFHLRYEQDMKYLYDMGIPRDIEPPKKEKHAFKMIVVEPGGHAEYMGTYRLTLTDAYKSQLSDT